MEDERKEEGTFAKRSKLPPRVNGKVAMTGEMEGPRKPAALIVIL